MSYEFNMVDMGGIDLATANGTVVDGLYNKLLEGIDACGNLILYNWKFAEIEIVPSSCTTLKESSSIVINGLIEVTEQDEVTVLGIAPPPVPVKPLLVESNGIYTAVSPVSGFNPVSVNVPIPRPRLIPTSIVANGDYTPPSGVDGFNSVTVEVTSIEFPDMPVLIHSGGIANYEIPADGLYAILLVADGSTNVDITVSISSENILYSDKQQVPIGSYGACGAVIVARCSAGDILTASPANAGYNCLYVVNILDAVSIEGPTMVVAKDNPATATPPEDGFSFIIAASTANYNPQCTVSSGWSNTTLYTSNRVFRLGLTHGSVSITSSGESYAANVSFAMKIV